ncbi:MAG: histone deacetylase [Anaerolineae bacterium]|nr:histone deacetylase [Anaerolineae bacterium]
MPTAFLTDSRFAAHTLPGHPEYAGRLTAVQGRLEADDLLDMLARVDPVPATDEDILAVHEADHLARLARIGQQSHTVMIGPDTYATPQSYDLARLAAGGVLRVVDAVMQGNADNGAAAIRPPGHHATPHKAMGFCLMNNVAVAARYVQRTYGIGRVAIMDFDVHHGNGTQDIFVADPSVLYVSTHQSPLYPGTGLIHEMGEGIGDGYTVNVPLPPGTGDQGYALAFERVVLPAIQRFEPEFLLISAGFDAHWADPFANIRLSLAGLDRLVRLLIDMAADVCQDRIVFVLEGGYNLDVLSHGWAAVMRALLGQPSPDDPLGRSPGTERSAEELIERIRQLHKLT